MNSSQIPEVQSPKQRRLSVGANLRLAQPLGVSRRLGSVSHSPLHLTSNPPLLRDAVPFLGHDLFRRDLCDDASFARSLRRRKGRSPGSIQHRYFPARALEIQTHPSLWPFHPQLRQRYRDLPRLRPRRNMLVVKGLFRVLRLRPWCQPFCGASSARASISACKPCNTMRYPRTIRRNLPR